MRTSRRPSDKANSQENQARSKQSILTRVVAAISDDAVRMRCVRSKLAQRVSRPVSETSRASRARDGLSGRRCKPPRRGSRIRHPELKLQLRQRYYSGAVIRRLAESLVDLHEVANSSSVPTESVPIKSERFFVVGSDVCSV